MFESKPREIKITGRRIFCDSADDCELLTQARSIGDAPAVADGLSVGRLHLIKDACQRYSLGKHQRLVNKAIQRSDVETGALDRSR
jgi:hypothetical protein